jgi:hypothetical protein
VRTSRVLSSAFLAVLFTQAGLGSVCAADAAREDSTYGLPRPADLTPEQQARILKAFVAADAALHRFTQAFPNAMFSMVRADPKKAHLVIATTLEFEGYSLALVYSGDFDTEFRTLERAHCDLFGAYDNARELKPRERRAPLRLKLEEMDAFCREPLEFLRRRFAVERETR